MATSHYPTGRLQSSTPAIQRLPIPGLARAWKEQALATARSAGPAELNLGLLERRILDSLAGHKDFC